MPHPLPIIGKYKTTTKTTINRLIKHTYNVNTPNGLLQFISRFAVNATNLMKSAILNNMKTNNTDYREYRYC